MVSHGTDSNYRLNKATVSAILKNDIQYCTRSVTMLRVERFTFYHCKLSFHLDTSIALMPDDILAVGISPIFV